jgi:iron complex transport system ATP-binding protein
VITVLHDLNLAARYANDVALLAQGRVLRHGSPDFALDPEILSTVYGIKLGRAKGAETSMGWLLAPY